MACRKCAPTTSEYKSMNAKECQVVGNSQNMLDWEINENQKFGDN